MNWYQWLQREVDAEPHYRDIMSPIMTCICGRSFKSSKEFKSHKDNFNQQILSGKEPK